MIERWRRRRAARLSIPEPVLLPAKTDGFFFEATFEAAFFPRRKHLNPAALARGHLFDTASAISRKWEVDQSWLAEDALNCLFGSPMDCPNRSYLSLHAVVRLRAAPESIDRLLHLRADQERIRRLTFLKDSLYSDPRLMAIDCFERNPAAFTDFESLLQQVARMSNSLKAFDVWWGPIMAAWAELAAKTQSQREIDAALRIILEALSQLDSSLVRKHDLHHLLVEGGSRNG